MNRQSPICWVVVCTMAWMMLVGSILPQAGCKRKAAPARGPSSKFSSRRGDPTELLMEGIASTLNHLAEEIDEQLQPPEVILDASRSSDRKEVLAVCTVNQRVPDGPVNRIQVPAGNAGFRRLGVRPGDIVRYYINVDEESREHGIEQRTYLQLTVRRLDAEDPDNALIIEGGLTGLVAFPERLEIWRYSDRRMEAIRNRLELYVKLRRPAVGWEPTPDEQALTNLVERINQWLRGRVDASGDPAAPEEKDPLGDRRRWHPEPLVETLSGSLRTVELLAPMLRVESLRNDPFLQTDGRLLQQAIWLRDISDWAKGSALADVEVAKALLDWTVRNVQLVRQGPPEQSQHETIALHPWQVLMVGRGTAQQRAWVFAELCRQQQLDVVMLAVSAANRDGSQEKDAARPLANESPQPEGIASDLIGSRRGVGSQWWLPALWSDGQLWLFDTVLGLPILGPDGRSVATLEEVVADDRLLRRMDIGPRNTYRIEGSWLAHIETHLVASPMQLSRRALLLEQALEGEEGVVLASQARRLADELRTHPSIAKVRLWEAPFRAMLEEQTIKPRGRQQAALRFAVFAQRPKLWKARVLHFQGFKPVPFQQRNDPLAEPRKGHHNALRLYQDRDIRPPDAQLRLLKPEKQVIYRTAKEDASYWLGLLCYDMEKTDSALFWLEDRTLSVSPQGPWASGASYNLARTYEALGKWEKAIELLESGQSPMRHGNLLRARRLRKLTEEKAASDL